MSPSKHSLSSFQSFLWAIVDKRTPFAAKALLVFGLLYGVSPLDFVPDILPLIGQVDDIGIIIAIIMAFLRMSKPVREDLEKHGVVETTASERK